jgi:hypothetical protein
MHDLVVHRLQAASSQEIVEKVAMHIRIISIQPDLWQGIFRQNIV